MVHLKELKVGFCNKLKEIVAGEEDGAADEIVFTNLKYLDLFDLQSLTAFCLGNYTFTFPSVEQVTLRGIFPNLRNFCLGSLTAPKLDIVELRNYAPFIEPRNYWEGDLNATIKQLHVKMVGFENLRHFKLSQFPELKENWHNQFQFSSLKNLTELVVDECGLFPSAIPSSVVEALGGLEVLVVEKCDSLEKVFDLDGLNAVNVLMIWLRELHLIDLQRLRNVWNKDPGGILSFGNLTLLKVHDCGELTHIFTLSVALDLVNLQQMEVKRCTSVEHIIRNEAEEDIALTWDKIIFPNLHLMSLECLASLSSFYSEGDVLECPSLTKIDVVLCPKIDLFASTFSNEDVMVFAGKVAIPSLEELKAEWNIVKDMLNENFQVFLHRLKLIGLACFPGESAHLPSHFIQSLPNLEKLILSDGFSEETILHELKHLGDEDSSPVPKFQNLETLQVLECRRMKNVLSSSLSFQNLSTLEVSQCHGLINLMTSSVARSLVQLRRMNIKECEMVQEIVARETDAVGHEIVFIQLKYLGLHGLPRLKSFCSGSYAFNFPSLAEVIVRDCPSMKIFAQEVLATQKLWRIQTGEYENEWEWEGDLNKTIEALSNSGNGMRQSHLFLIPMLVQC